jgi:hypothetical protein
MQAIQPGKRSIAVHLDDRIEAVECLRKMLFAQLGPYIQTWKPIAQSMRMLAKHGGRNAVSLKVVRNCHHQQ